MKNYNSSRYRSLLKRGARALAMTSVLLAIMTSCGHGGTDTDNSSSKSEVTTTCTTSTTTSTSTTSTTSSTTTSTSTTTTTSTAVTSLRIETTTPMTETVVQTEPIYVEPATEYIEPVYNASGYSEDDVTLLAKLINHEASATYDGKVMVGSCVVNRMNAKGMSVAGVIYEPNQFTTAYSLTTYNDLDYQAAQQVLSQGSVDTRIYFFDGCHGDGLNWFYDINRNYLGAW